MEDLTAWLVLLRTVLIVVAVHHLFVNIRPVSGLQREWKVPFKVNLMMRASTLALVAMSFAILYYLDTAGDTVRTLLDILLYAFVLIVLALPERYGTTEKGLLTSDGTVLWDDIVSLNKMKGDGMLVLRYNGLKFVRKRVIYAGKKDERAIRRHMTSSLKRAGTSSPES